MRKDTATEKYNAHLRLLPATVDAIAAAARREGLSMSQVVDMVVREKLGE